MARWGWRSVQHFLIGIGLVGLGVVSNQALLQDWLDITPQPPSAAIEQLATATTMTRSAQRLFYRQNPTIEARSQVVSNCAQVAVKGIMLGCYSRQGQVTKITLQSVTEPRLQGIMEITAAHEMLHAAYDKLSEFERDGFLTPRLEQAMNQVKDARLLQVLNQYKAGDRSRYINELHSHLGTELLELKDPELENYYQRYFSNRRQLVSFAQRSGAALRQIDARAQVLEPLINQLEKELSARQGVLNQAQNSLKSSSIELDKLSTQLNQTRSLAEQATSPFDRARLVSQFEIEKVDFNEAVRRHNTEAQSHQTEVDAFNQKVDDYKKKVTEYNQLGRDERSIFSGLKSSDPSPESPLIPIMKGR